VAKYDPLRDYLAALPRGQRRVVLPFKQIEQILGAPLPPSAYAYPEWWEEHPYRAPSSQVKAWTGAGWVVDELDLQLKLVAFRRR
jgi:hypothetical protein